MELIARASAHVDAFLPVSQYYMDYMPDYLGMPADEDASRAARDQPRRIYATSTRRNGPFTIGYLARVAPEKGPPRARRGVHPAAETSGTDDTRLVAAGYLPPEHTGYLEEVRARCDPPDSKRSSPTAASSIGRRRSRSCTNWMCCRCRRRTRNRRDCSFSRRWPLACRSSSRGTARSRRSSNAGGGVLVETG